MDFPDAESLLPMKEPPLRRQGSFASMSSRMTSRSTQLSRAQEAAILSQASSQAMTAAKSILMAGGNHVTALSTAKAAAQAVLCPSSGGANNATTFLSRRRAKRQAEVIASMALISVTNALESSHSSAEVIDSQGQKWELGQIKPQDQNHQHSFQSPRKAPPPGYAPFGHQGPFDGLHEQSAIYGLHSTRASRPSPHGTLNQVLAKDKQNFHKDAANPVRGRSPNLRAGKAKGILRNPVSRVKKDQYEEDNLGDVSYRENIHEHSPRKSEGGASRDHDRTRREGSRDRSAGSGHEKVFTEYFRKRAKAEEARKAGTRDELIDNISEVRQTIPSKMPMNRSRTKDLAAKIPLTDPIYETLNASPQPSSNGSVSESSFSEDETEHSEDVDSADGSSIYTETCETPTNGFVEPKGKKMAASDSFLRRTVDPFLASITNVFNCGEQQPKSKKTELPTIVLKQPPFDRRDDREDDLDVMSGKLSADRETDGDRSEGQSDSCGSEIKPEDGGRKESAQKSATSTPSRSRPQESKAIFTSDQLLRELASSADEEDQTQPGDDDTAASIRESMERIVLGALSVGTSSPRSQHSSFSRSTVGDRITQSRCDRADEVFAGVQRNPSSDKEVKASHPQRKKPSRIRKWIRRVKPKSYGVNYE